MKKLSTLILGVTAASIALPAFAAPFKDADGNIHIQDAGITASQVLTIEAGTLTKKVTANYCGLVVVGLPPAPATMPASVTVGTDTITVASLPVQAVPKCVDNVLSEARAANFKDATGRVIVVGKTPGVGYSVTYPGVAKTKNVTANACGLAKISNTTSSPAPATFVYLGTTYTTASLPTQNPAKCISGVKYTPAP